MGPSPKVAHPLRRAGGSERRWRAVVAANPPLLSPDLARPRLDPVEVGGRPSCGVVRGRRWAAAVHVGLEPAEVEAAHVRQRTSPYWRSGGVVVVGALRRLWRLSEPLW